VPSVPSVPSVGTSGSRLCFAGLQQQQQQQQQLFATLWINDCVASKPLQLMNSRGAAHAFPVAAQEPCFVFYLPRFTAAGGLYALFLLLHHELCGVHPSKMASSLLTLLNLVLHTSPIYKVCVFGDT